MAESHPQIRFGIMGCASIAVKLARAITMAPNSVLHAVASRSIEKAEHFVTTNGLSTNSVKIYGNYTEILDDPLVDVVYIPLPTSLHVHWAIIAAEKKKHLLVEKPAALHLADLDKILGACVENGVQFMDGAVWFHHPRTQKMKEFISDSQSMGHINFIRTTHQRCLRPLSFPRTDIRTKLNMDALGEIGDLGWYRIGAVLWAKNYQTPTSLTALPNTVQNSSGVVY